MGPMGISDIDSSLVVINSHLHSSRCNTDTGRYVGMSRHVLRNNNTPMHCTVCHLMNDFKVGYAAQQ